jgi:membrane protein implicated in regulation of membrane protease activity
MGRIAADAVRQTELLVRAEFALAKADLYHELRLAAAAAAALVGALLLLECALLVWAGALVLWLGTAVWLVALVGVGFAVLAGLCAWAGKALLSRRHLSRTEERIRHDVQSVKESAHA